MKKNKFSKALKHLKSKKLDEKIKKLDEAAPTNNMSGVYQQSPRSGAGFRLGPPDPARTFVAAADGSWPAGIPGTAGEPYYVRPPDHWTGTVDWETITKPEFGFDSAQGNNTDGLIDPVTNVVKTQLPPGSRGFILGPLVDGFVPNHVGDAFTRIGYIEKDTRQFVLLGIINGEWISGLNERVSGFGGGAYPVWDGSSSGFSQVNPNFTLDMALWFRNEMLKNRFVKNVSYNAVGGIPQLGNPDPNAPQSLGGNGVGGGSGEAGKNPDGTGTGTGSGGNPDIGTPQGDPDNNDIESLNLWGINYNQQNPKPKPEDYPNVRSYRRALAKWNREKRAAEQEFKNQQNQQSQQNQGQSNNPVSDAASKIAQKLWQGAKFINNRTVLGSILGNVTGVYALGDNLLNQGQTKANSASDYNFKLSQALAATVVTGKPQRIILSKEAKKDLINSIDTDMLKKHLTVGPTPKIDADNAINPGKGKVTGLLKGNWGNQGGTHINYDPSGGGLTITSVKMLRDFGDLDEKDAGGKITNFHDIPNPTTEQIQKVLTDKKLEGPLKKMFKNIAQMDISPAGDVRMTGNEINKLLSAVVTGDVSQLTDPNKFDKPYGDTPEDAAKAMYDALPLFTKAVYNFAVEGTASNAVHLRNQLLKLGIPKSDVEKMGGGFGGYVYSQETYYGNDIPGNHSDKNSVTGVVNRAAMRSLGIEVTESRKIDEKNKVKILREIRQPLKEIKELPKTTKLKGYKPNFKGKYSPQNTPDVTASKRSDQLVMAKNAEGQAWTVGDKYHKGWETTGRMNHVYARVGESDKFFEQITANNSTDVERKMQEHLNHVYHNKAMLKIDSNYKSPFVIDEQETFDNKINDPLFTKVAKSLKKEIDYPKKPAKAGYPNEAPPKIDPNTGYHPKFGKRYKYDKLDPISAKTMAGAPTGDPEIDANVKKAAKVKEDWRSDLKNLWLGSEREDWKKKIEEGMTTQVLTGILPSTGNADLETLQTGLTGNGDIDYGEGGLGDEVMAGEGEYTCFSNLDAIQNANDPNNVGTFLRLFDQNTKQFRSGSTGGGHHGYLPAIPGYVQGMMRNAKPSGDYNQYDKSRRVRDGLPLTQNGSDLYYHLYGPTNDVLGSGYGTWNSNDGVTATNTGTRLDFDGPGSPRYAALKAIDSTGFDTIKIHALLGDDDIVNTYTDNNGTVHDARVQVYYWAGDHKDYVSHPSASSSLISGQPRDGWRPINLKPNGEVDPNVDPYIIKFHGDRIGTAIGADGIPYSTNNKNAPYSIPIPDYTRSKNAKYMLVQVDINGGSTSNAFSVLSVRFQRRSNVKTPALTKPLTDIETSPFVRVGPTKKNEGGKERKKKVKDIIDGGLNYTERKFSKDFPVRTTLESKLFEKLKDRKIIKEGMTTQVLTGILPSAGNTDLDILQLGASGNDLSYTTFGDVTDGQFTALTNTDTIDNVNDPHGIGTRIRSPIHPDGDASLDFTPQDPIHTSASPAQPSSVPGDTGGMRGVDIAGNYNVMAPQTYVNAYGATNENIPLNHFNDELLRDRVGTYLTWGTGFGAIAGFPRFAALKAVDTSEMDTLSMNWFMFGTVGTDGNDESPTYQKKVVTNPSRFTEPGDGVVLFYWAGDKEGAQSYAPDMNVHGGKHDGWRPINVKPDGTTDNSYSAYLIPHRADGALYNSGGRQKHNGGYPAQVLLNNKITLPPWCRDKNTRFLLHQGKNKIGANKANFGITSVRFQRRSMMKVRSLMKPLSDVETSPFVRVGPTKKNEGGKQRKKKVQDIIRSGLKYTGKKFSKDFPVRTDLE